MMTRTNADGAAAGRARSSLRLRRRRNVLIGAVLLAIIASVGGLLLSTSIKSPAQVAAHSAPPPPTLLTVPVTRQVITSTVQAQGMVKPPREIAQLRGQNSGGGNGALPVVTKIVHRPGSTVGPGSVIVEVAGRPLFVFGGSVPAYRNLQQGESGTDVTQLQQGLESLGYSVGGDTSGVFGPGTGRAVAAYYQAIGYPVPTVPGGRKPARRPMVPLSEIMFVPALPAQVVKVAGPVGQEATGSLVTLALGDPAVAGQLNPADAALVRRGMGVTISDPASGTSVHGTILSVSHRTQTRHSLSGGVYVPFRIMPDSPLPLSMAGHGVSLRIAAAHSRRPVLAVPEAAVFARADGRLYVTKVTADRRQVPVPVRVTVTGDGLVGVVPAGAATLTAGDQVVTGLNYAKNVRTAP
jgi:Putative peptidoglycan binding domain